MYSERAKLATETDKQTDRRGRERGGRGEAYEVGHCIIELLLFLLQVEVPVGQRLHHLLCPQSSVNLTDRGRGRRRGREEEDKT